MTDVCEVIITAPDPKWLATFVRGLVDDHLCAAGHIFPMHTIYRWQGEVHDTTESRVHLHTQAKLVDTIIERTNREHPYEVACVAAIPISQSDPAYAQWIIDVTTETGREAQHGNA